MRKLQTKIDGYCLHQAGLPGFPRNFTRDSIISGILARDPQLLQEQLVFCALNQGSKKVPISGEEPGKIFHEYPGVDIRGHSTLYNGSDTTALFLIGHECYQKFTGDEKLAKTQKKNILRAVSYIKRHLRDGAFIEDPKFAGAKKFALKVTYWKDSVLFGREKGEPVYPIIYPLAHIQNMRAIKSAIFLLKDEKLQKIFNKMQHFLRKHLIDKETKEFYMALDRKGLIRAVNSDPLHALFYLDKKDLDRSIIKHIEKSSKVLETKFGYRTLCEECSVNIKDNYHAKTIWPFEQALINIGARKFSLKHVVRVSNLIKDHLSTAPEIYIIKNGKIVQGGNDPQLWTMAAKKYFKSSNKKQLFI
jgi:glycogen debranching enzyme